MDSVYSRGRIDMQVYFDAASLVNLDGAMALMDATSFLSDADHTIWLTNSYDDSEVTPLLIDQPEVRHVWVDGETLWTEPDPGISRLTFSTLCWPRDPRAPDPDDFDCQSFKAAWIEFECAYAATEAGAIGVPSWVTGPSGDTLCIQPG